MKRLYISLLVVLASIAGCIFSNSDHRHISPDTIGNLGVGKTAYAYLLMMPGQVWNYHKTTTETSNGITTTDQETVTQQCVSTPAVLDAVYFVVQDSPGNQTTYWYNGDDVYMIVPIDFALDKPAEIASIDAVDTIVLHESEQTRLWYRFDVPAGTSWKVSETHWVPSEGELEYHDVNDYYSIVSTARYIGTETITTPAGTFTDCKKFEHVTISEGRITIPDDPWTETDDSGTIEYITSTTTYTWFAHTIGMVRKTETSTSSENNSSYDFSSYTETVLESREYTGASESGNKASFSITGKVVNFDGAGISGASVSVSGGNSEFADGITGSGGCFTIEGLPRGRYHVNVSHAEMRIIPALSSCSIVESDVYMGTFLGETKITGSVKPRFPANRYLHFIDGAAWRYEESRYDGHGNFDSAREFTVSCLGEVFDENAGVSYVTIDYDHNNQNGRYRIDGGTVYWYEPDIGMTIAFTLDKPAIQSGWVSANDEPETWNWEMPVYRFDKQAGYAWEILSATNSRDSSYVNLCLSAEYSGLETVETGAGVFEDCARFVFIFQSGYLSMNNKDSNADIGKIRLSGSMTLIETRWFAPDTGMVKKTAVRFEDGDEHQADGSYIFVPGQFRLESSAELTGTE